MLPFVKERNEAPPFDKDEGTESYGMIHAIADDIMSSFQSGNKQILVDALKALVEHIQTSDERQDAQMGLTD